jgi:hypothetical protein
MVCFASAFSVLLRIGNVIAESIKRIRYKGIVCDRCGVEVTEKKVRRERMGHIKLGSCGAYLVFPFTSK